MYFFIYNGTCEVIREVNFIEFQQPQLEKLETLVADPSTSNLPHLRTFKKMFSIGTAESGVIIGLETILNNSNSQNSVITNEDVDLLVLNRSNYF